MGVLFQGGALFSSLTVRENIMVPLREHTDLPVPLMRELADMKIHMVGLPAQSATLYPSDLSGGMKKRAGLARALSLDPKLLFLDEPSLGLSPILVKEIFEIIRTINAEGVTILLVEQNAKMALSVSQTGLILENGRFVMKGQSCDLMEDKDVKEFYMGVKSETSAKGYQRWKRKKAWR